MSGPNGQGGPVQSPNKIQLDILPCPFCGSQAELRHQVKPSNVIQLGGQPSAQHRMWVECVTCHATGTAMHIGSQGKMMGPDEYKPLALSVLAPWNQRSGQTPTEDLFDRIWQLGGRLAGALTYVGPVQGVEVEQTVFIIRSPTGRLLFSNGATPKDAAEGAMRNIRQDIQEHARRAEARAAQEAQVEDTPGPGAA